MALVAQRELSRYLSLMAFDSVFKCSYFSTYILLYVANSSKILPRTVTTQYMCTPGCNYNFHQRYWHEFGWNMYFTAFKWHREQQEFIIQRQRLPKSLCSQSCCCWFTGEWGTEYGRHWDNRLKVFLKEIFWNSRFLAPLQTKIVWHLAVTNKKTPKTSNELNVGVAIAFRECSPRRLMKPKRIDKLENEDKEGVKDPCRRGRGRPEKLQLCRCFCFQHLHRENILKMNTFGFTPM